MFRKWFGRQPAPEPLADPVALAVIGAGRAVRELHAPALRRLGGLARITGVYDRDASAARAVAESLSTPRHGTDPADAIADRDTEAVLIATGNDSHVGLTLDALAAGKDVYIEKPLAISRDGLGRLRDWFDAHPPGESPIMHTGHDRRFAPLTRKLVDHLAGRSEPMVLSGLMCAWHAPDLPEHGPAGGGRCISHACHAYDLTGFLVGAPVVSVRATPLDPPRGARYFGADNFTATLRFEDGSLATLLYAAICNNMFVQHETRVFADGFVYELADVRRLSIYRSNIKPEIHRDRRSPYGTFESLEAFLRSVRDRQWRLPLWQQLQTADVGLQVREQLEAAGATPVFEA